MKKTISTYTLLVAVFALGVLTLGSCSKNNTNANQQFIGTYVGAYTVDALPMGNDTLTMAAGTNGNSIIGTTKSTKVVLNGTVSGNNITFPDQGITVTVAGNPVTGTAVGTGTLTGGTALIINLNDTLQVIGAGTYSFTGAKY